MPETMKTRKQEVSELLDDLDAEIMQKYSEIEHAWLYNAIAQKVKLEIEFDALKKQCVE